LRVIRQGERVSQAALEVAQTYPFNPKLGLDVRPWARESNGNNADVLVAASLLQEIELAGQGSYRERAGAADLDRARHEILQAEILTISEAARRFFTALYRRERRDLEERFAGLKEERLGSVERRFDAGMANAGDVSLAKIEARLAREQAMAALASEDAALKDLAKYVGSPPGTSLSLVGRLESREWKELAPPERSGPSQADALLAGRPDVLAAEASLKAASARSDLAAASRVPNVSLGPVYERDEAGTQFLGVEAQIPLPVFNGGGPLLRQRQAEVEERQEALKQAQLKAKLEADAAASRYERARALVAQFREDLSGGLENELERVKNLYEAGQADILQVYGARASVLQARKSFLDAVYEVALSAADWTAATAQSPEVLLSSPARKERPR
jgi:outer membrane protein TolC